MRIPSIADLEDRIFNAARRSGVLGVVLQGLVMGSVASFYIAGSLSMQAGRAVGFLWGKVRNKVG